MTYDLPDAEGEALDPDDDPVDCTCYEPDPDDIGECRTLEADRPLGHVVVNRHGQVCAYVAWPKPDGVEWPESWDKSHPEDAPHRVAALVPIEEEDS